MAVPNFLASAFRATQYTGVTDVNTIIAALMTELVTNGVWTDTGGTGVGPFKSLPCALDGSYQIITVARVSATRISYIIRDHLGNALNVLSSPYLSTTQDINAAGTSVGIYSGPNHVCVETYLAAPETWYTLRLNVWPDTPGLVRPSFVASFGPRDSNGTLATNRIDFFWNLALGATAYGYSAMTVPHSNYNQSFILASPSGAYIFVPVELTDPSASVFLGRYPQMLMGTNALIQGSTYTVPIDVGVTGTFRILYLTSMSSHGRFIGIRTA